METIIINGIDRWTTDSVTAEDRYRIKENNDFNWYLVDFDDGSTDIQHRTMLSAILECGHDPLDYGIINMEQCV